jgi:hypothetical protein
MAQRGVSLEQIHQDTGVKLEVLEKFLPHVIKETVVGLETQIDAQGKGPYEISRLLGASERAVLAYTLDCKTYSPPMVMGAGQAQPIAMGSVQPIVMDPVQAQPNAMGLSIQANILAAPAVHFPLTVAELDRVFPRRPYSQGIDFRAIGNCELCIDE